MRVLAVLTALVLVVGCGSDVSIPVTTPEAPVLTTRTCQKTAVSGTNDTRFRLTLTRQDLSGGDTFYSCEVAVEVTASTGSAVIPKGKTGSCDAVYDVDGYVSGRGSYGTWRFTDDKVVYVDGTSPFDGTETVFSAEDCQ